MTPKVFISSELSYFKRAISRNPNYPDCFDNNIKTKESKMDKKQKEERSDKGLLDAPKNSKPSININDKKDFKNGEKFNRIDEIKKKLGNLSIDYSHIFYKKPLKHFNNTIIVTNQIKSSVDNNFIIRDLDNESNAFNDLKKSISEIDNLALQINNEKKKEERILKNISSIDLNCPKLIKIKMKKNDKKRKLFNNLKMKPLFLFNSLKKDKDAMVSGRSKYEIFTNHSKLFEKRKKDDYAYEKLINNVQINSVKCHINSKENENVEKENLNCLPINKSSVAGFYSKENVNSMHSDIPNKSKHFHHRSKTMLY